MLIYMYTYWNLDNITIPSRIWGSLKTTLVCSSILFPCTRMRETALFRNSPISSSIWLVMQTYIQCTVHVLISLRVYYPTALAVIILNFWTSCNKIPHSDNILWTWLLSNRLLFTISSVYAVYVVKSSWFQTMKK